MSSKLRGGVGPDIAVAPTASVAAPIASDYPSTSAQSRNSLQDLIDGQGANSTSTPTLTSSSSSSFSSSCSSAMSMDSSFPYELPMEWRPSQSFDYQPYPSPFPSPAPSYVSNRQQHHPANPATGAPTGSNGSTGPSAASPTLSSITSSPHHGPTHAHSHSHSAPIDPSLQDSFTHTWSHPPSQQQQQPHGQPAPHQAQSPIISSHPHPHPVNGAVSANSSVNPYATPPPSAKPASSMSRQELEQELARLKTRVNELEVIHHWLELKGMRLEAEVQQQHNHSRLSQSATAANSQPQHHAHHAHHAHHHSHSQSVMSNHSAATIPVSNPISGAQSTIVPGGVAPTEDFAASWRARTDARIKRFCALNRAGNALCAWHDSRRERRAYPPRQAPPGYLNCGCTNDEALFEESLARHGVGSYHPGEMVRMDPALRNPLLKLLQTRFGYVDGDFERDAQNGLWLEGEGAELWENILPTGKPPVSGGRKRGETK
ncbi:hypothetical protein FRC18_003768 [Serendipita sp. 400]|nr:hypothetical protein FRC18_003768 [Serendipita sp. 400]